FPPDIPNASGVFLSFIHRPDRIGGVSGQRGSSLGKDRRKDLGAIGHDRVDAEVKESMHLLRVVDRPDVHVDSAPVSELDEPASDNRD
mgnify:CR=1